MLAMVRALVAPCPIICHGNSASAAGRTLCPLTHCALDRARQPGVGPVAGEVEPRTASGAGAAGCRAPARTSRASRGRPSRARARAPRRARQRLRAPRRAALAMTRRRPTRCTSSSAPLATSDRCDCPGLRRSTMALLSNTQCIGPPRQADERLVHHHAVEPEIDRHDRLRAPSPTRSSRSAAERRRRCRCRKRAQRVPRHRGDHRRASRPRSPPDVHVDPAPARRAMTRASAPVRTSPPRDSMIRAGRLRVQPVERARRQRQRRRPRHRGPNSSPSTRTNGAAAASSGDWFSAATASGSHSHSRSRGSARAASSHADTVVPSGASDRRRVAGHRAARRRESAGHRSDRQSIAPAAARPSAARRRPGAAAAAAADSAAPSGGRALSMYGTTSDGCTRTLSSAPTRRRNAKVSR